MDVIFGVKDHLTLFQECARAVLIFFYGLAMLRLSGKRTFARWSALDMVLSIVIGSNLSRALTGSAPLPGTLAAVAVLVALHVVCSYAAAKSSRWSHILEGTGVVLGRNGTIDHGQRCHRLISEEDLQEAIRTAGLEKIEDTKFVVLEANGKLSIGHKVDAVRALGSIAEALEKQGRPLSEDRQSPARSH